MSRMMNLTEIKNPFFILSFYHAVLLRLAALPVSNKVRIMIYRHLGMRIGKDAYIGPNLEIVDHPFSKLIVIGTRVSIAARVTLVVSSGPNNSRLKNMYPRKFGEIIIEEDAWLATGVIVLPGITIGKMSIIGSGSVVTKNVPPYSVAAGVPARVIKKIGELSNENTI
ncbi:MAG: acyltransferase [Candidatus Methanoperedens sp.]|nr:acyltransferase [Candidatus Methanoperedens sp.]